MQGVLEANDPAWFQPGLPVPERNLPVPGHRREQRTVPEMQVIITPIKEPINLQQVHREGKKLLFTDMSVSP